MKKRKKLMKYVALIIISILMASFNVSFAEVLVDPINNNNNINLDIEIRNVVEPVLGETPEFDYNFVYEMYPEYANVEFFDFLGWSESEYSYSKIMDELNTISSEDDFFDHQEWVTRVSMNPDFFDSSNPITEFLPNKTYIAFFNGYINYEEDVSYPESSITTSLIGGITPKSLAFSKKVSNEPQISASVNGSTSNVVCFWVKNGQKGQTISKKFMVAAVYRLDSDASEKDIKATVNWIDARDENIPESLILRLRNGNSVIKEQTLNKSNAIDSDTWEFDFGEYPLEDDEGNPIEYTLEYAESKDGDLKFFTSVQDGFIINNTFIPPEITSKVKMTSMVDREINNVKYKIEYNASIKKYSGNANILITATLPFSVDVSKSDLDDGKYDEKSHSIIWEHEIEDIDKTYDYSTTKNVDLYATAVLPYSIETVTIGQVQLEDVVGFSETVDATDVVDNIGNPKTGDINIAKNFSIALVGLGAILMVIQIKRKYSTRKNNVLF